jgi:putative SOS response-associated peptidase YedK
MCGRYAWSNPQVERFRKYAPPPNQKIEPRYNRAPGQKHPVIKSSKSETSWGDAQWGNFPSANSLNKKKFPINARSETVAEKPTFEQSFQERRCLVPADGYYEWQVEGHQRKPHFFHLTERPSFAFAGLWKEADGQDCFTILTRSASSNCLHLHHRMPVILPEEAWEFWLDPHSSPDLLLNLLRNPAPVVLFYPVSKKVNATREDGPELLERDRDQQTTLF